MQKFTYVRAYGNDSFPNDPISARKYVQQHVVGNEFVWVCGTSFARIYFINRSRLEYPVCVGELNATSY